MDNIKKTEPEIKVYNATTEPVKVKAKNRDKSDLGDNFVAPDGGWAWVVCIAAGISNLMIFPPIQQFGFIFRERLFSLGLASPKITTIINTHSAVSACTGLLNGPMFRRFSFRQVALTGSLCMFFGLVCTAFADSFAMYITFFSICCGFGMGISISSSSLAINTYFRTKRRRAAGFSWTITGLGPIFLPYLVTFFLAAYGVQGTVLIFAAITLHSFVCGLIYQPVMWHVKEQPIEKKEDTPEPLHLCKFCESSNKKNTSIFSSQYLYMDDDKDQPGFEITDPGTPMLSRANDGWYGSKMSLSSTLTRPAYTRRTSTMSNAKDVENSWKKREKILEENLINESFMKPNNFNRERDGTKKSNTKLNVYIPTGPAKCTCEEEREMLQKSKNEEDENNDVLNECPIEKVTFFQKVVAFFDLDLLKDFTFVNLVLGLTIINFGEINFSILTPFILNDFGFTDRQISMAMSLLGGCDISVRFLVPFITEKIKWDNRVFFLIGVVGTALGRTIVAYTRSFPVILGAFVWIGISKGIRTIFWPLIIPGYVPLKRLPAASGLQLISAGMFTFLCGPFVGVIRDRYDFSVTLHCLNMLTFIAAISWSAEALFRSHQRKKLEKAEIIN